MSIYQVLITRTKTEERSNSMDFKYEVELAAYSEPQYFSSLEKAQAFCQQYVPTPIIWARLSYGDIWVHECDGIGFSIYLEEGSFDTTTKPPLPFKFVERPERD